MKSAFAFAALAAVAAAQKPEFLNSDFNVQEGQPFTLKFSGCDSGCAIAIQTGPSTNLQTVKTLTSDATGSTFTFTPSGLPSGTYNFKISEGDQANYSMQFTYVGTGTVTSSASSSQSVSSATSSSSSSTSTSTSSSSTTMSSVTSSSNSTTTVPSTTSSQKATTTSSTTSATTTIPNSSGNRASSPLAFVAGAIAALAYFG